MSKALSTCKKLRSQCLFIENNWKIRLQMIIGVSISVTDTLRYYTCGTLKIKVC